MLSSSFPPFLHRWLPLLLLPLPILWFWIPSLTGSEATFIGDTLYYFYPYRWILAQALQAGYLPYWDETLLMGQAFCASPQANCFYPMSVLYAGGLPFLTAYHLSIVLHLCLGALFTFYWLRQAQYSTSAATFAGILWGLGGPTLAMVNRLDKLESLTWWPLALWSVMLLQQNRRSGLWMLVSALSMMILAGGLEVLLMALPMLFAWGLMPERTFPVKQENARPHGPRVSPLTVMGWVVLAGMITLMLTWPQLDLLRTLLSSSTRASGLRVEQALELSLRPAELLGLLSPTLLFDPLTWLHVPAPGLAPQSKYFYGIFVGWLPLYLMGVACWATLRRPERRPEVLLSVLLIVGAVLFALGRYFPLTQALFEQVPAIRTLRFPEKSLSLAFMALLPLSARGLEVLERRSAPQTSTLFAAFLLFLAILLLPPGAWRAAAALLSVMIAPDGQPTAPDAWWYALWRERFMFARSACVLLVVIFAFWCSARRPSWSASAAWLAPVLLTLELLSIQNVLNPTMPSTQLLSVPKVLAGLPSSLAHARLHVLPLYLGESLELSEPGISAFEGYERLRQALYPNLGVLYGLRYADGAQAIRFRQHNDALANLRRLTIAEQLELLPALGLELLLSSSAEQEQQLEASLKVTPLARGPGGLTLWQLIAPLADAYVCPSFPAPDSNQTSWEQRQARETLRADQDWRPEVCWPLTLQKSEGGRLKWGTSKDAGKAGRLVLPISHVPGWQAWVDEQPVAVETIRGFQLAVPLREGWQTVRLEFPGGHFSQGLLPLLGLSFLLLLDLWRRQKNILTP
ncbi:MAG: hypothetical protein ACKO6N_19310 [Myxococcota bacterium]